MISHQMKLSMLFFSSLEAKRVLRKGCGGIPTVTMARLYHSFKLSPTQPAQSQLAKVLVVISNALFERAVDRVRHCAAVHRTTWQTTSVPLLI